MYFIYYAEVLILEKNTTVKIIGYRVTSSIIFFKLAQRVSSKSKYV